jgi:hypothetical protein
MYLVYSHLNISCDEKLWSEKFKSILNIQEISEEFLHIFLSFTLIRNEVTEGGWSLNGEIIHEINTQNLFRVME